MNQPSVHSGRLAELVDRALLTPKDALRIGRRSVRDRVDRLRSRTWFVAQSALGAGLAWWVAGGLLGHQMPFLAPIACLIVLGQSYGQRLRRTLEVVVGVAIGVLVGDVFRLVFGVGWWQVTVVVLAAMVTALVLGAGQLMVTQAAAQAVVVTAIVGTHGPFERWIDAVVGAVVALVLTTLAPSKPLRQPRRLAAAVLREVADILQETASAVEHRDREAAEEALTSARDTERTLQGLTDAVREGLAAGGLSLRPHRNQQASKEIAALTGPTDHAIRNLRVLTRRAEVAVWRGERLGEPTLRALAGLPDVCRRLADEVEADHTSDVGDRLVALVDPIATTPGVSVSDVVIGALLRSFVVDLLEVGGLSTAEARARIGPPADPAGLASAGGAAAEGTAGRTAASKGHAEDTGSSGRGGPDDADRVRD